MESALSSPRKDKFPAGLRVLVVDDDLTWLKILEKMLRKCSYQVTTCCLARDALMILRERKEKFDIVISDVNMPDMDGFKLLEHVGLEMDLPVIMMSVDGETSRVMRGVQHGACDYLLKPIRMKELSNIWQHVYRKKMHEVRNTENHRGLGNVQLMRNESDDSSERNLCKGGSLDEIEEMNNDRKKRHADQDFVEFPSSKKSRVVWSIELHQKFLDAVNYIGLDKLGPKKILDTMNVPGLTRDNVASHLQKFRLYLNRLQSENEQKNSPGCVKQQEILSGDSLSSFDFHNSSTRITSSCIKYGYATNEIPVDGTELKYDKAELKGMVSFSPVTKPKKPLTSDLPIRQKAGIGSQRKPSHSLNSLELTVPPIQRPGSYPQQVDNFCLQPSTTIDSQSSFEGYNSVNRSLLSASNETAASGLPMASPLVTRSTKYPCVDQNYAGKRNLLGNTTLDELALLSLEENVQSGLFQGYCGSGSHINDHYSLGLMADMGFQAQQFG